MCKNWIISITLQYLEPFNCEQMNSVELQYLKPFKCMQIVAILVCKQISSDSFKNDYLQTIDLQIIYV